ncbi:hypothetical protein OVA29_12425 [Exiguobacterium sp. SL14]|nr:hypothetical protein [Exiguobacterium sp. SL14]MCY1691394.1 hypothetical protein [Exiguobacterium sp. SL14]
MKKLIGTIVTVYILLSLPALLGIGRVIDWVPDATMMQIIHVTVVEALSEDYIMKFLISISVSILIAIFLRKRKFA